MNRHEHTHCVSTSAAVGVCLVAALAVGCGPENETSPAAVLSQAGPAGVDGSGGIEWVQLPAPGGTLTAAVARPTGTGPVPVLVVLHGTHGFAREYVRLAQDLAREGRVVAVAGCWFAGGQGAGRKLVTPIDCPDAPAMSAHWSLEALESASALVAAAHELPGVRDRGHRPLRTFARSRRRAPLRRPVGRRAGRVLNSTGYDQMVIDCVASVDAPLLLLHGTEDAPPTVLVATKRQRSTTCGNSSRHCAKKVNRSR
jgi:hypothetical protein